VQAASAFDESIAQRITEVNDISAQRNAIRFVGRKFMRLVFDPVGFGMEAAMEAELQQDYCIGTSSPVNKFPAVLE
jgi:hypothetical protein